MKKILLFVVIATMSLSLSAGDCAPKKNGQRKSTQSTLTTKKSKKFHKGWYKAIGTCNLRYGPGENYKVAYQIEDGEPVYVVKKKGNWYGLHHGSDDPTVYWTHVTNLKAYYGPVTWS